MLILFLVRRTDRIALSFFRGCSLSLYLLSIFGMTKFLLQLQLKFLRWSVFV